MKRIYIITILITICGLAAMAQDRPDLTHQSTGRDRIEFSGLTLVYNNGIITVNGTSDYYDVTITSWTSLEVVDETVVDGNNGIINVSSLSRGTYTIELTSAIGNVYQWTFYHSQSVYDFGIKGEFINRITDFNLLTF